ncbi:MAG: hypothetical protein JWP97_6528 [Labilithrix sp.]|nr:hypothetical protein [Labilithrix sp.]
MPLTHFFLASMAELRTACPGWKDPLPHAVKRTVVNPFTKQPREITTTSPDPADPFEPGAALHANLAPLFRVDLKGLSTADIEELVRVVLEGPELEAADVYEFPLHGPPESEEVILRTPQLLVDRLARMNPDALEACLEKWNEATDTNLGEYLAALADLARRAVAENRQVFMWMCP